jgi:hypothetical protein
VSRSSAPLFSLCWLGTLSSTIKQQQVVCFVIQCTRGLIPKKE